MLKLKPLKRGQAVTPTVGYENGMFIGKILYYYGDYNALRDTVCDTEEQVRQRRPVRIINRKLLRSVPDV